MFWQANKMVKKKKKSNICGCNSSALRQVYSLVLAGWIPEINFPDPGSENNSLSFVRETRLGPIFISGDNLWPQNHMTLSAGDPAAARQSVWDAISLSSRHFLPLSFSLSPTFSSFLTFLAILVTVWKLSGCGGLLKRMFHFLKKAKPSTESFIYLFFGSCPITCQNLISF